MTLPCKGNEFFEFKQIFEGRNENVGRGPSWTSQASKARARQTIAERAVTEPVEVSSTERPFDKLRDREG